MAAAASVPTPTAECQHPSPYEGVMATEFAHYDGAQGPEGTRRTVTFYGPVIGGLPILAWHCEDCGLLKLEYPDGRHEERSLFAGPQPGLIRRPTDVDPAALVRGRQPRVSGLSVSRALYAELEGARERSIGAGGRFAAWMTAIGRDFYALSGWTQAAVFFLVATMVGLGMLGLLAVYTFATPQPAEEIALLMTGGSFVAFFLTLLAPAVFPMPPLAPSPADAVVGRTPLSSAIRTAVGLFVISMLGALVVAIGAVYDYNTPSWEGVVVITTLVAFAIAVMITVVDTVAQHRRST